MKFNKAKFKGLITEQEHTMLSFCEKTSISISTMNYMLSSGDMKLSFFFMLCNELNVEPSVLIKQD